MFITSFSQNGWNEYGKRFLKSFLEKTAEKIAIYVEDDYVNMADLQLEMQVDLNRVEVRSLWSISGAFDLIKSLAMTPAFRGVFDIEGKTIYSYRHDAHKFCRKVLAVVDHAEHYADGPFAWIDADTYFHEVLPDNFIASLLEGDVLLAYLGRKQMYSECGFMAFNPEHPLFQLFMVLYRDQYTTGAFSYMTEYHDCFMFDHIRTLLHAPCNNLTPESADEMHPWAHSILAKYVDHVKGPKRKQLGFSPEIFPDKFEGAANE